MLYSRVVVAGQRQVRWPSSQQCSRQQSALPYYLSPVVSASRLPRTACNYKTKQDDSQAYKDDNAPGGVTEASNAASKSKGKAAAAADKFSQAVRPAHSSGGPTAGLVAKTQELYQRFKDTPGDTFKERWTTWFNTRSAESAADATGVTWPSETITRVWKFFFKAGAGTTDRYGFAIQMGPVDQRSDEQRAELRRQSAASVVNIDPAERTRRVTLGLGIVATTAVLAAVLLSQDFAAEGSTRLFLKAGLYVGPFFFGMAQIGSGLSGMWSIALASIWDVDGTGMQQVPTAQLDLALRKKLVYILLFAGLPGLTILGAAWMLLVP